MEITPDKIFTEVIDGQEVVRTVEVTGDIVPEDKKDPKKYVTALVRTSDGLQQAVKTYSVGGGGGGITVDDAMSDTSTNPVQNKVITAALGDKQDTLVSGTNIKTVNNNSLLGSGNVDIDALPDQTGQGGKFLTTDGTDASWGAVPVPAGVYTEDNLVGGTGISIDSGTISGGIDSDTLLCYHFNDSVENLSQYASGDNYTSQAGDLRSNPIVTYVNGEFGKALAFDGTSNINFAITNNAYNLYGLDEITYEFWQKLDGTNSVTETQLLLGNPRMTRYTSYGSSDSIQFGIVYRPSKSKYSFRSAGLGISDFELDATQEGYLNTNGFNHLALCWKSGQFIKVYVNGHLLVSNTNNPVLASYQQSYPGEILFTSQLNVTWWAIDEFRFSKVLRYTGDSFEVPTKEFDSSTRDVKKINNTQPAPSIMTGATSGAAGTSGLVPAPAAGDQAKYLTGAGTWQTVNALQNTSTGTDSLTILGTASTGSKSVNIGYGSKASSLGVSVGFGSGAGSNSYGHENNTCIGYNAQVTANNQNSSVVIGSSASTSRSSTTTIGVAASTTAIKATAIGAGSIASGERSIAIGGAYANETKAQSSANFAIQIGPGDNSTVSTFSVGLDNSHNYQLLDSTGTIPLARLPIVQITQADYDALVQAGTVDANKLYFIVAGN